MYNRVLKYTSVASSYNKVKLTSTSDVLRF